MFSRFVVVGSHVEKPNLVREPHCEANVVIGRSNDGLSRMLCPPATIVLGRVQLTGGAECDAVMK